MTEPVTKSVYRATVEAVADDPQQMEAILRAQNLPPVGEPTDKNPVPVGEWVLLHLLMKQNGHDWHEEIDACRKAIHNRVQSLRSFHGPETALEALDSVIADLETARESLEEAT